MLYVYDTSSDVTERWSLRGWEEPDLVKSDLRLVHSGRGNVLARGSIEVA